MGPTIGRVTSRPCTGMVRGLSVQWSIEREDGKWRGVVTFTPDLECRGPLYERRAGVVKWINKHVLRAGAE